MALFFVISANSGSFRAHCIKVHVRDLMSWCVLVLVDNAYHCIIYLFLGRRIIYTTSFTVSGREKKELECGPMPNVMAALPSIGGALCESSVILFLVPRRKVSLTPTVRVPCSNAINIGERETWMQSEFCTWQNAVRGQEPPKMYISVSYTHLTLPTILRV